MIFSWLELINRFNLEREAARNHFVRSVFIRSQFLQIAIFGDFMYIYVKSIRSNSRLVLPDKIIIL